MAQIIIILTTVCFLGFLITAFLAFRHIRKNKKSVHIDVIIEGNHVIYKFKPQTFEFENYEILIHEATPIHITNAVVDGPLMKSLHQNDAYLSKEKVVNFEMEYA